jgi:hypothetical protein
MRFQKKGGFAVLMVQRKERLYGTPTVAAGAVGGSILGDKPGGGAGALDPP